MRGYCCDLPCLVLLSAAGRCNMHLQMESLAAAPALSELLGSNKVLYTSVYSFWFCHCPKLLLNVLSHVPGCHSVCFCLVTLGLMKIIIIFSSSAFFTDPHKPGMISGVGVFPDSPSCSLVSWRADSQYCPFLHHGPLSRMMAREPCVPAFPLALLPCHRRRPTPSYE